MKVKTSELTEAALDWAVAKAAGIELYYDGTMWAEEYSCHWSPSEFWNQCGPLIERYRIGFGIYPDHYFATAGHDTAYGAAAGSTHLIAACRAIVAAELGSEVDVPDEVVE